MSSSRSPATIASTPFGCSSYRDQHDGDADWQTHGCLRHRSLLAGLLLAPLVRCRPSLVRASTRSTRMRWSQRRRAATRRLRRASSAPRVRERLRVRLLTVGLLEALNTMPSMSRLEDVKIVAPCELAHEARLGGAATAAIMSPAAGDSIGSPAPPSAGTSRCRHFPRPIARRSLEAL